VRRHGYLAVGCALIGFVLVVMVRARPVDPQARLPEQLRLAGLINTEQGSVSRLRADAEKLRAQVDQARRAATGRQTGADQLDQQLGAVRDTAGLAAVEGAGLKITLDDSDQKPTPGEDPNDLVIHSQDVQAAVNAAWRAGAEAMSISDERLVTTSAVICVGNTLLINGTVLSPPYVISAIGANRTKFESDSLVRILHQDASAFGLRFSVTREDHLRLPAYDGAVGLRYARPQS
jgi:uncharacterized protein YlxW (UPF0749 family)